MTDTYTPADTSAGTALDSLRGRCADCRACPLWETRTKSVFGVGDSRARLMFVGEAPGGEEDKTGIPFVGAAGKLLDRYLYAVGIARESVYIANILKCRPPHNRDPLNEEQAACRHWLDAQRDLIRPKLIVCLGRIAAMAVIKPDFRITREHGQWFDIESARAMAIYHPSALLRDITKRPETFADLRSLRSEAKRVCERLYK